MKTLHWSRLVAGACLLFARRAKPSVLKYPVRADRAWLVVVTFLLTSCAPTIQHFEVAPRRVCAGEKVTVSWAANGHVRLERSVPPWIWKNLPERGTQEIKVTRSTRFSVWATRFGRTTTEPGEADVTAVEPGRPRHFSWATRPEGNDGIVAAAILEPAKWGSLRVGQIRDDADRPLVVIHDGRRVSLPKAGAKSNKLAGLSLSGGWELHAKLRATEHLGDPAHAPPARLAITVVPTCGDGAS